MMTSTMLSAIALMALICIAQAGHGMPPCTHPQWVSGTQYCAGQEVQHNSAQYNSVWCTFEEPGTGAEYDGWESLGACAPTSPTPTPTSTPTGTPTPTPTGTPTPTPTGTPTPTPTPTSTPTTTPTTGPTPAPGSPLVIGYFASWKVYYNFYLKNLVTSGSAPLLTHIVYAFGGVNADSTCYSVDPEADTDKIFTSANSVDGSDDAWDQPLRGNFNQILQLKRMYPHIKVLWSFGGWTLSGNFGAASRNADKFAESCYNLVFDERFKDTDGTPVFDGIDIDWEYPNACGATCDDSGPQAYATLLTAVRNKFGSKLVTSAITGDGQENGKIDKTDYAAGAEQLDFMMVMTYDYFGAWDSWGPTAPHAPLFSYDGIPIADMYADKAIQKLKSAGVPSEKLLFGIPFYGRGWTGVSQSAPGGSASGPAAGVEPGVENYNILKETCPHTGFVAATSYSYCSPNWWSYDTPESIRFKTAYAADQGLGGMFTWELSGDTDDAELLRAMAHDARSRFRKSTKCLADNHHYRA